MARDPLSMRWGLWVTTRYMGRARACFGAVFIGLFTAGLLMVIGYLLARYPGLPDVDLAEQSVAAWLWNAGLLLLGIGVLGYVSLPATARARVPGEHDPGYDRSMQRLVLGAFLVGTVAAGAAIVSGAGGSERLFLALLPIGVGLAGGLVALVRA